MLCRELSDVKQMMDNPASVLHQHRANIILVEEPVVNNISSTVVRHEISQVKHSACQPHLRAMKVYTATICQTHRTDRGQEDCKRLVSLALCWLQGRSVRYLVPDAVIDYIENHLLYSNPNAAA